VLDKANIRLMILEALEDIMSEGTRCSECGATIMVGEDHSCSEEDLDEFSGAGAVAGYSLPLGMRPAGPRRNIKRVAQRSFGGIKKKKK
jgi:hypothetical protein